MPLYEFLSHGVTCFQCNITIITSLYRQSLASKHFLALVSKNFSLYNNSCQMLYTVYIYKFIHFIYNNLHTSEDYNHEFQMFTDGIFL